MLVIYFEQLQCASCYVCPTTIFFQFQVGIQSENNNVKVEDVHGRCQGLVDPLKLTPNNIGFVCRFSLKLNKSISCFLISFHIKNFVACIISSYSRLNVQCICHNTFQAKTMIPIGDHQMIFLLLIFNTQLFSIT